MKDEFYYFYLYFDGRCKYDGNADGIYSRHYDNFTSYSLYGRDRERHELDPSKALPSVDLGPSESRFGTLAVNTPIVDFPFPQHVEIKHNIKNHTSIVTVPLAVNVGEDQLFDMEDETVLFQMSYTFDGQYSLSKTRSFKFSVDVSQTLLDSVPLSLTASSNSLSSSGTFYVYGVLRKYLKGVLVLNFKLTIPWLEGDDPPSPGNPMYIGFRTSMTGTIVKSAFTSKIR